MQTRRILPLALAVLIVAGCTSTTGPKTAISTESIVKAGTSSLVAPNSGRLVGKVKDGPISALVGKNKFRTLGLADTLVDVGGAQVEVMDEDGKPVSYGSVTTDSQGAFVFRKLNKSTPVLYLRVTYQAEGTPVVMRAIAVAPRTGTSEVVVDPGSTFVAKKTLTLLREKAFNPSGVDPKLAAKIAAEVLLVMDEDALAAAVLRDDTEASRAFDKFLNAHPDLANKIEQMVGKTPLSHLLDPTTGAGGAGGGNSQGSTTQVPEANTLMEAAGVTHVAGGPEPGNVNGPADVARFNVPYDVASAPDGTLYVADSENNAIRKIAPDGTVSTIAGDGEPGFADGPGDKARFNAPSGVAVAPDGSVYVSDFGNHRIRKITADGTVSTLAGTGAASTGDGPANKARFNSPSDLTLDKDGNVYVADTENNCVRRIDMSDPAAPVVSTVAGSRTPGLLDGTGDASQFTSPADVAIDARGDLYVADTGNHTIRRINMSDPAHMVSSVAGSGVAGYLDAAVGTSARLNTPYGLAFGPGGVLYVADANNNSVRMIQPSGAVGTFWGDTVLDPNKPRGLFNSPSGLALRRNAAGVVEVFVADSSNHAIRKFALPSTSAGTDGFTAK